MKQIILIVLFVQGLQLSAQEGFIKSYNFNYPTATRFNAMIQNDSELIVCGYINDTISPYQTGIFFSKIDTTGEVLSYTTYFDTLGYDFAAGSNPGGLIRLEDNSGYLFTGSVFQGSDGFLSKWDLQGELIWVKKLEDNTAYQGYYFLLLETETGFLVGGVKQLLDSGENDVFLMKTDKSGNQLWEKQYGEPWREDGVNSLIIQNNNEYVLGGTIDQGGVQTPTEQIQIFAVDSLGEEKWYWESETPAVPWELENIGCVGLHQDGDGNWVYATRRFEYQSALGIWFSQGQFVVRDDSFNLITEKTFDDIDGDQNHFINLITLADGDWLGLGVNYEDVEVPTLALGHNYGYLTRMSSGKDGYTEQGDSLWTRKSIVFPDTAAPQQLFFHSAVELPSGSIIAAGYFKGFGYSDHGLLMKVNQHGCTDTLNCTPTNFPNVTSISLTTCDSSAVGTMEFIYPDQNGEDSIVVETTTLLLPPASPNSPIDTVIEENALPFTFSIEEVLTATAYEWTVPVGIQIISGQNTNTITINWDDQIPSGTVCVTALNECGSSSADCMEITVDFTDGLEKIKTKAYSIFPNPARDFLTIVFEEEEPYELVLLDALGRIVLPLVTYSVQSKIETKELAPGTYWVRIGRDDEVFWERVEILR